MERKTEDIPKLIEVITEDALRVLLQGFFRKTEIPVSIYVDPTQEQPIYNESDSNPFCREKIKPGNPKSCLKRNIDLAKKILQNNDLEALEKFRKCEFGLCHWAEVIKHKASEQLIAAMSFGGIVTNQEDLKNYPPECWESLYMNPEKFEEGKKKFKKYAQDIEDYYNAHVKMMDYTEHKTLLTTYRSLSSEFPSFIEFIHRDLDITFDNILRFLSTWTGSRLSALCILDQKEPLSDPSNDILVVRRVIGIKELEKDTGEELYGPENFELKRSFVGRAIMEKEPDYTENLNIEDFQWWKAVSKLKTKKALALPLILQPKKEALGALICFPEREIWLSELKMFADFARKIAVTVHMAIRNELYRRNQTFRNGLMTVSTQEGDKFYRAMAGLICKTLPAAAASIFILDRTNGYLKLIGTTDNGKRAKELQGRDVYKLGEGITGSIAAKTTHEPYGEIVYDLYADRRRSSKFEEVVPETRSGKHSLIATQICSPQGEVLGVVRCVDVYSDPEAVFNCFNHFYLEGLQFWAGILGIIYTMKVKMRLNHEFILTFTHEFESSLGGLINNIELGELYLDNSTITTAYLKLHDAITIAQVMAQYLDDIQLGSLFSTEGKFKIESLNEEWCRLETDFLMPMKNSFQHLAHSERGIGIHYRHIDVELKVDKKRIIQVFTNLLRNAIKYSYDPKDRNVSKKMLADIQIESYIDEFGMLCIDFVNQGIRINYDEKDVIFDLYRKGRNVGAQNAGGLGLGLYICKEIMRLHDGDIYIKSYHHPTIITIRFPSLRVKKPERRSY